MKKMLKTTNSQKIGSFTVTPKISDSIVWFNLSSNGGTARYNLNTGEFEKCRNSVGRRMESFIEDAFIQEMQ